MTEHDYRASQCKESVAWVWLGGRVETLTAPNRDAAAHFAATLNRPDLTAAYKRLTAERDGLLSDLDTANLLREEAEIEVKVQRAEVERLTAERDEAYDHGYKQGVRIGFEHHGPCRGLPADPEAPPIPCVEVDPTDGRRTWRAMGEDVRTLGDEWESVYWNPNGLNWTPRPRANSGVVYLIRRTEPPKPRTERVNWWEAMGRVAAHGNRSEVWTVTHVTSHGNGALVTCRNGYAFASDTDGTVEVLTEDGDQ